MLQQLMTASRSFITQQSEAGGVAGVQRLFKYISGANEDEQKIEMTAPVVTRVIAGDGPFCKSLFSVHFFVPFKWQVRRF